MKNILPMGTVVILSGLLIIACQKANEPQPRPQMRQEDTQQQKEEQKLEQISTQTTTAETIARQPAPQSSTSKQAEEAVPLITEVMTKEELQAYLKEKGIPIITKENFKEPELVWERTFDEPIAHIYAISDLTEKGNCIVTTGRRDTSRKLLFLDKKGNTRKEIALGKVDETTFAVARSGKAAIVGTISDYGLDKLTYYDEEGNQKWTKQYVLNQFKKISISDNGESIAIEELNPKWSEEEWSAGNLNVTKLTILGGQGTKIYEYRDFRNLGWGEFSGDGKYYAGLFWWQKDSKAWGKLIYVNVKEGRILWERPFGGNWRLGEMFGEDRYLAVSEQGNYVAAVDIVPAENIPKEANIFDYFEIVVFNKKGETVVRVKAKSVYRITEKGLIFVQGGNRRQLADVNKLNAILQDKEFHPRTAPNSQTIIEMDARIENINFEKYFIYSDRVQDGKGIDRFENFRGDLLFERHYGGVANLSMDGKYFKVHRRRDNKDTASIFRFSGGQND